jgi:hypothetical protein
MKNLTTKQKLRAVFKTALWGAALSLGLSLYIESYFEAKNDLSWDLLFLIPTTILSNILGLETPKWGSLVNSFAFMVIANGLLVTFVFVVFAFFWQFVVKGSSKNQTTENK